MNGGTRYSTHLLKTVKSSDFSQVVYEYEPQVQDEINIAQENLDAVTEGMRELTTGDGSLAYVFQDLPFEVGAKTGSAQVSAATNSNAVFVCYAPYDDPEIAISLVVEHGGSGSVLASPGGGDPGLLLHHPRQPERRGHREYPDAVIFSQLHPLCALKMFPISV